MTQRLQKAALIVALACSGAWLAAYLLGSPTAPATAAVTAKASQATVQPDGRVTFTLSAPQANQVVLNFQNEIGASPASDPVPMSKDAGGTWSVTLGPLKPNLYGYGFIVDGVRIADPANRDVWAGATSQWSTVFVPGPESDFMAAKRVPHGAVATVRYYSKMTGTERQMQVYTPPGYNNGKRYPVLYLMHGGGGNDTDWIVNMRANYILDNLIASGKADRMIVVMPDGYVTPTFDRSSVLNDRFPDELVDSIVPYIDANYNTKPGGRNRALAGLSLGGLWTFDTLLRYPGTFGYIGQFSSGWFPETLADLETNHRELLDGKRINKKTELIWITAGPQDIAWTNNLPTRASFDKYGVRYTFVENGGRHVWDTWRHNLNAFAPLLFR